MVSKAIRAYGDSKAIKDWLEQLEQQVQTVLTALKACRVLLAQLERQV